MARHVMAMTYKPKIAAVQDGRCWQTIRAVSKRAITPGDTITFHGWEDKPYRSPWSWRKEVIVKEVIPIKIYPDGIEFGSGYCIWDSVTGYELARLDFIDPPLGLELKDVLFGLNTKQTGSQEYIIIRW